MTMRIASISSCAVFCLATLLPGQANVLVVDEAGGPGSQFTDLPQAVTAAMPGDVLDVRPGSYTGFSTGKGIHLLGRPGVRISRSPSIFALLTVNGVPAGQRFTMRDVVLDGAQATLGVSGFLNCAGNVVLENVGVPQNEGGLFIDQCAAVEVLGYSGRLLIEDSNVSLEGSLLTGYSPSRLEQFPAIRATNSRVVVSGCTVRGGVSTTFFAGPVPAIRMSNSDFTLSAFDATDSIMAGTAVSGSQVPVEAVFGSGTVLLDAGLPVTGSYGGLAFSPNIAVTTTDVPSVRTSGAALGGLVQVDLRAAANEVWLLAVGFPRAPVAVPGVLGDFWLDGALLQGVGTTGAGGQASGSLQTANDPSFLGLHLAWQAVTTFSGEPPRFSNPAVFAVRF